MTAEVGPAKSPVLDSTRTTVGTTGVSLTPQNGLIEKRRTRQGRCGVSWRLGALLTPSFKRCQRLVERPQGSGQKCEVFQQKLSGQNGNCRTAHVGQENPGG